MTRLTSHSLAVFAAILITATSLGTIISVPPAHALASMPILA